MALSEADRVAMLEKLAADEGLKATQRLRALEELGRIEARKAAGPGPAPSQEDSADPMADFSELDELRARREQRRRAS